MIDRKYLSIKKASRDTTQKRKESKLSYGELKIAEFLGKECITFYREYFIKGLYSRKRRLLYFDFYIPEFNLFIEFDGEQHYAKNKSQSAQENDFLKNAYCKKNKYNLLRIKYSEISIIEEIILKKIDKLSGSIINSV